MVDVKPEEVRDADTFQDSNDPAVRQMLHDAEIDNRDRRSGSRAVLFVHLRHAERLWRLLNEFGIVGDRFVSLAKQMTGYGKSKAHQLAKLHEFTGPVQRWVENEAEAARHQERPFQYPSWQTCLSRFARKEPKEKAPPPEATPDEPPMEDRLLGGVPPRDLDNMQASIDLLAEQVRITGDQRDAAEKNLAEVERAATSARADLEAQIERLSVERDEARAEAARWKALALDGRADVAEDPSPTPDPPADGPSDDGPSPTDPPPSGPSPTPDPPSDGPSGPSDGRQRVGRHQTRQ